MSRSREAPQGAQDAQGAQGVLAQCVPLPRLPLVVCACPTAFLLGLRRTCRRRAQAAPRVSLRAVPQRLASR